MICVNTQVSDNLDLEIAANNEENFDDNPQLTKAELRKAEVLAGQLAELAMAEKAKFSGGKKQPLRRLKDKVRDTKVYVYRCPVYTCTMRLSQAGGISVATPVFYVNLNTYEKPRKWIKRSVALLMERSLQYWDILTYWEEIKEDILENLTWKFITLQN